jgi:hypothetical protein
MILGCGSSQNDSFMSDGLSSSGQCSSSGCAVSDSTPYISLKKTSTYFAKPADLVVEINGDCYVGSGISNSISLSLVPSVAVAIRGLNIGDSIDQAIRCVQGKFNFLMEVPRTPGVYKVTGVMNIVSPPLSNDETSGASVVQSRSPTFTLNLSVTSN